MARPGRKAELFKPFLFADQDLDLLVDEIVPPPGVLAEAAASLRAGNPADAEVVLTGEIISRPSEAGGWHRLLLAAALERRGNVDGATRALRQLADASGEARIRLWAWKALRRLGVEPDAERKDRVEGVVVEVDTGRGVETLAVYSDGTARYLLPAGAKFIWDAPDKRLAAGIAAVVAAATALAPSLPPSRLPAEPAESMARMTLLTPVGPRAVEERLSDALSETSPQGPLFAAATALLDDILKIAKW